MCRQLRAEISLALRVASNSRHRLSTRQDYTASAALSIDCAAYTLFLFYLPRFRETWSGRRRLPRRLARFGHGPAAGTHRGPSMLHIDGLVTSCSSRWCKDCRRTSLPGKSDLCNATPEDHPRRCSASRWPAGDHRDLWRVAGTTSSEMFVDVAGDVAGGGLRFPLSIRRGQFSTTPMLTISLRNSAHSSPANVAHDAAT